MLLNDATDSCEGNSSQAEEFPGLFFSLTADQNLSYLHCGSGALRPFLLLLLFVCMRRKAGEMLQNR